MTITETGSRAGGGRPDAGSPTPRALSDASAPGSGSVADAGPTGMRVTKRNGAVEPVDLNKIVNAIARASEGLLGVDPMRVATRTISALADGATTRELDELSIRTAAGLIVEEPNYSRLASRLLATIVDKEVRNQNIPWFSESVKVGYEQGIVSREVHDFVEANAPELNAAIDSDRDRRFEFFGLRTVYDRYLLRHPVRRDVIETPQYFFLRVACGLVAGTPEGDHRGEVADAVDFYDLMSSLAYLPSSPTLFNSGTTHSQMSSCYLLDSPTDSLEGIYKRYTDIAKLSKFAGGIGVAWHRIRSKGSLITGTNGLSNGIVPWLRTLDSSVAAVNQGGRRKGAACVYLESWHADIEDFLELRDNTGDHARRTHNLNIANWVPDLFMERVEKDWQWSLFDPKVVPQLTDLYGDDFDREYQRAEEEGLYERQVPARQLYSRMMRTLAQTGNGWMTFKDASNEKCNQTGAAEADGSPRVVHLSNLCTEILEVTDQDNTAVCNLGSLNLGAYAGGPGDQGFDFERLGRVVRQVVPFLDRVIDINYYPTPEAQRSNEKWRPVGLGLMGLQDVFFTQGLAFDSPDAKELSRTISAHIYFHALWASTELAERDGPHGAFDGTRAAGGDLQFDLWTTPDGSSVTPPAELDWEALRGRIREHGLRNSLLVAIAPTATIASIAGCYECIEPQVSNLFKRETLSGEFMQINRHLVRELQARGLWDEAMISEIKQAEGSVQGVERIPAELREVYRTAWEIPQRQLIDMAAERGAFIDQSQSLNLFIETPTIGKLSSMYLHAWKSGLKTTYYLRSRAATKINKSTTSNGAPTPPIPSGGEPAPETKTFTDDEAVACSLENPESCEACD
ncbi:ribonucleoside-diphosphate reductase subunit alpha [Ilumatobacter sp.]|uniref:ribonucleoside-diphosphate reductase subunit alpha n=1 Tax=Ilumatobacter sp. TaxID=1967498 RepID=UPI003B52A537